MKPIELTQEQQDKLLEMCNKLFPKKMSVRFLWWDISGNKMIFDQDTQIKYHWFEFCMTHLAEELVGNDYFNYRVSKSITSSTHIVDGLYEQFLKLKK